MRPSLFPGIYIYFTCEEDEEEASGKVCKKK